MCPNCEGVLKRMLKSLEFESGITFTNVPVTGCDKCEDEVTVSFDHGLMIDHYKRNHCKEGDTVDFNSVQPLYATLNALDIIALENNQLQ